MAPGDRLGLVDASHHPTSARPSARRAGCARGYPLREPRPRRGVGRVRRGSVPRPRLRLDVESRDVAHPLTRKILSAPVPPWIPLTRSWTSSTRTTASWRRPRAARCAGAALLHRCTYVLLRNAAGRDPGPPPHGHQGHLSGRVRRLRGRCLRRRGILRRVRPAGGRRGARGGGRRSDVSVQASLPGTGRAGVGCACTRDDGTGRCARRRARWPGTHGSRRDSSIGCSASCPSVPTRARSSSACARAEKRGG